MAQLDAKKTGFNKSMLALFKSFEDFKKWYDPRYKNEKAENIWKQIGGTLPKKKKEQSPN